ncbi:hypothetical protein BgiBS90_033263, partial [Biomphalaria glabrata]
MDCFVFVSATPESATPENATPADYLQIFMSVRITEEDDGEGGEERTEVKEAEL